MKIAITTDRGRSVRVDRSSDRSLRDGSDGAGGAAPPRRRPGLYSDAATLTIDARNRTFSPQYPLWSDGATKRRWVRLPAGSQINVAEPGEVGAAGRHEVLEGVFVQRPQGRDALPVADAQGPLGVCVVRVERRADRRRAGVGVRHRQHRGHRRRQAPQHPVGVANAARATTRAAPRCSASTRCSCRPIAIRTRCTPSR